MSQRATVLGCSAFGLHDSVATPEGEVRSADFFLADVLLPGRPFGTILTGNGAQSERVHSGLPWPPEAQCSSRYASAQSTYCLRLALIS